jgi:hypothetical protein
MRLRLAQLRNAVQILPMIGKAPRYSLAPHEFPFRALAALAGRAQIGGVREVALATLVAARLTAGVLGPHRLPLAAREARAGGAKNWLLSIALPPNSRTIYMRLLEATGTDDIEYLGRSFAEMFELADPHLDQPARLELGRLVHRISSEISGETLEHVTAPAK